MITEGKFTFHEKILLKKYTLTEEQMAKQTELQVRFTSLKKSEAKFSK